MMTFEQLRDKAAPFAMIQMFDRRDLGGFIAVARLFNTADMQSVECFKCTPGAAIDGLAVELTRRGLLPPESE